MCAKPRDRCLAQTKPESNRPSRYGSPLSFMLRFMAWLLIFGVAYALFSLQCRPAMGFLTRGTAQLSGLLARLIAGTVTVRANTIEHAGFTVAVIDECSAVFEILIFVAAVLSIRVNWRRKFLGLVLGVPAIVALNVTRIFVLLLAGAYSASLYEFLHLYLWQATIIVSIAAIWWGWLRLTERYA
jgi:archaeosortase B (VPXXXP-CTERM-specific)